MTQQQSKKEEIAYWKQVGDNSFKEGNYLAAIEAYETVTISDPRIQKAWKGMATAFSYLINLMMHCKAWTEQLK